LDEHKGMNKDEEEHNNESKGMHEDDDGEPTS
jgi:hypothetical protein